MKYNSLVFLALVATVLAGCSGNDENVQHYTNKVFISAASLTNNVRIEENMAEVSREIVIGVAKPEDHNIAVSFKAAPELLDTYRNAYYDPKVVLLPAAHYDLSQAKAAITAGKITSDPLSVEFINLDQLDLDARYVLPVTIASADGVEILDSRRTLYYLFKEASLVNVAANMNDNWAWPGPDDWKDAAPVTNMSAFTLETLLYANAFKQTGDGNISTVMGIEDLFLIRIGDSGYPSNQLQVAYGAKDESGNVQRGDVSNASLKLQAGVWYHLAVTFDNGDIAVYLDGVKKASGKADYNVTSVNFATPHSDEEDGKPRCFWIGRSYNDERWLNGMLSETRIWKKALTDEEIAAPNHFYKVDTDSDGLVAYWKFDEGAGNVVKDHTAYGNHLSFKDTPTWADVELPVKEE